MPFALRLRRYHDQTRRLRGQRHPIVVRDQPCHLTAELERRCDVDGVERPA
jgi:hypothetical protein